MRGGLAVAGEPDAWAVFAILSLLAAMAIWLLETVARMHAETRYLFTLVSDSIFRYFGENLVNIPPIEGAYATALTTWTMLDDAGYTISAGTHVAYRLAGDKLAIGGGVVGAQAAKVLNLGQPVKPRAAPRIADRRRAHR